MINNQNNEVSYCDVCFTTELTDLSLQISTLWENPAAQKSCGIELFYLIP